MREAGIDLDQALFRLLEDEALKVPPYPAVALRVQELVRRESFGLDELTRCVASDQALAADALRLANSPVYSRGNVVTTLTQAVTRIGSREIARLAIASGVSAHTRYPGPLATLRRKVWLDAAASAAVSQELARCRGADMEEGFVAGLLHDFGKVVVIACVEELLARRRARPRPFEQWAALLDRHQREFGLVMAAHWKLPQYVFDVIALHGTGDPAQSAQPGFIEIVRCADDVVRLLLERLWLTPGDLRAIPALREFECEYVARCLERLPGFLASFEGVGDMPPGRSALVQKESPPDLCGTYPVDFAVKLSVARFQLDFTAVAISPEMLVIAGLEQLPEHVVMEIRTQTRPALHCWVAGFRSWRTANGLHSICLRPVALGTQQRDVWTALVEQPASRGVR